MANDFAAPMSSKELVTFTLSEVILPTVDIYTDFALALKLVVTFSTDISTVPEDVKMIQSCIIFDNLLFFLKLGEYFKT